MFETDENWVESLGMVLERLLTPIGAEVVRLAVMGGSGPALVSTHPTHWVTVLARRTEPAAIDVEKEPGKREREQVEVERVVQFEVRLIATLFADVAYRSSTSIGTRATR